ncbi:MAG: hypothetical protein WA737_16055, partial [Candidatus Acidiferrales bacterium]
MGAMRAAAAADEVEGEMVDVATGDVAKDPLPGLWPALGFAAGLETGPGIPIELTLAPTWGVDADTAPARGKLPPMECAAGRAGR